MKSVTFLVLIIATVFMITSNSALGNFALFFDGQDDRVECGVNNLPADNNPGTLEGWFRIGSVEGIQGGDFNNRMLFGYGTVNLSNGARVLAIADNGSKINFTNWGGDARVDAPDILDGEWHHAAVTHDGVKQTIYCDGEVIGNGNLALASSATNCTIAGVFEGAFNQYFQGTMDEVRIWDVARTQEEIQNNMGITLTGKEEHLVSCWSFDEGSGDITRDSTASKNDGTLIGGPKWVKSDAPIETLSVDAVGKMAVAWGKVKRIR